MGFSREKYQEELGYLVDYAKVDWLNFYPIEGAARVLVGSEASGECCRKVVLNLIGDMFDAGIRPIDLTPPPGPPFVSWATDKEQTLRRIAREMDERENSIDFIDICWFTFV
ncbi:hypothetical protein [Actinorugispora endophytica]|uniref:hypothetical protein n=1 Tax=Actinorugispora endophytica TaxID=1605990 RepID=UPI00105F4C5E|nr:hypothetical protein [Actinorugispora endophytica]